jgi:hypothetical protein
MDLLNTRQAMVVGTRIVRGLVYSLPEEIQPDCPVRAVMLYRNAPESSASKAASTLSSWLTRIASAGVMPPR